MLVGWSGWMVVATRMMTEERPEIFFLVGGWRMGPSPMWRLECLLLSRPIRIRPADQARMLFGLSWFSLFLTISRSVLQSIKEIEEVLVDGLFLCSLFFGSNTIHSIPYGESEGVREIGIVMAPRRRHLPKAAAWQRKAPMDQSIIDPVL